jgi:hypothetical protein
MILLPGFTIGEIGLHFLLVLSEVREVWFLSQLSYFSVLPGFTTGEIGLLLVIGALTF